MGEYSTGFSQKAPGQERPFLSCRPYSSTHIQSINYSLLEVYSIQLMEIQCNGSFISQTWVLWFLVFFSPRPTVEMAGKCGNLTTCLIPRAIVVSGRGNGHFKRQEFDLAVAAYTKAIESNPQARCSNGHGSGEKGNGKKHVLVQCRHFLVVVVKFWVLV